MRKNGQASAVANFSGPHQQRLVTEMKADKLLGVWGEKQTFG